MEVLHVLQQGLDQYVLGIFLGNKKEGNEAKKKQKTHHLKVRLVKKYKKWPGWKRCRLPDHKCFFYPSIQ